MRTHSGKEILEPFDPEIERSCRKKNSSESEMATINPEDFALLVCQVQILVDDKEAKEEAERRNRGIVPVMQMFNHGNMVTIPTIPRINANNFELRMPLIQRVEQHPFAGRATEDANRHLIKFVEIANTLKINGVEDNTIRVRLLSFSLIDSAKEWFECLPVEKISSWDDIVALFLDKYYPPGTILKLKSEICQFIQGHDELLYEAVARFKALLRKCPNHGFSIEYQVGLLHNGFTERISSMLDAGANGGFLRKGGREAMEVIEEFAANSRGWSKERHNMKRVAAIENNDDANFAKQLAAPRVRMDKIDNPKKKESIPSTSNSGGLNRTFNNYRPNQGGGFNVSKGGVVEPPKKDEKERYEQEIQKILEAMQEDRKVNDTKIGVVEASHQDSDGPNSKAGRGRRVKAADRVAELNKKWVAKKSKDEASTSGLKNEDNDHSSDHVSGPLDKPQRPLEKSQRAAGRESVANSYPTQHNGVILPFPPQQKLKLEEQFKHFLHKFCKLHINLSLVDALQEIPRYASLLREAVMTKHKLKKNDLKLPHHCSDIIQKHRPVKQRDPGQFIIRCSIGKGKADKALCDLGAGINIMPLEYYEKLNIGPLKATGVCIRLNSTTQAVGIVEDVLVKIDDFIFPADFFVLDMDVDKDVSLILGRNFLATCKALIDVGMGEITITDGHSKSTYHIERAMIKDEEAKRLKQEEELKMVMMTDRSKPLAAQKGEDYSKPSIFIVTPPSIDQKQQVPKQPRSPFQERTKKGPKPLHLMDAEVYVIKTPNGKYKWWEKIYNKLVSYVIAAMRVVDPPT
ncbi:hypothetical protein AAHA92_33315 [Salvia divinorum]|uniref:Retrotransposon gag domain-containing protein n=1 Tax=Salvia divinorum TaxID=28513 RepID=A0ABD1FNK2_SALDI